MFCIECGAAMVAGAKFCGTCGAKQEVGPEIVSPQSRNQFVASVSSDTNQQTEIAPPIPVSNSVVSTQNQPTVTTSQTAPVVPQTNTVQQTFVMAGGVKSMGAAILLSFFFGPLGLLYASVTGGVVMLIVSLIVGIFTLGFGFIVTWPICVIWAAIAVNRFNSNLTQTLMNGMSSKS